MTNSILETGNIDKKLRNGLVLFLIACLFILVYSKFFNVSIKNGVDSGPITMSDKEIIDMLISDTKHISLLVESIQKIPQEIAIIMEFQKIKLEEIKIIQNSTLLNSPELFGTALAYEPYTFKKDAFYFSSYLYREGDTILHTTLDDPEYDYFYQDWYLIPKILQKPVWSDPYFDEGGGGVFMTSYSVPFYAYAELKETFKGIVTVDVSIDWLANYFTHSKKIPNNGFIILIAEDGTVLSAPNTEWIMNETIFTLAMSLNIPELREVGRDLQKGMSGDRIMTSPTSNMKLSVFYSAIDVNQWGLLYLIPEKTSPESEPDALKNFNIQER